MKAKSADRPQSAEATLMKTYFADSELTELDRRMAETKPAFADPAEIATLFGKPFSE